jgi:hypothetical protein
MPSTVRSPAQVFGLNAAQLGIRFHQRMGEANDIIHGLYQSILRSLQRAGAGTGKCSGSVLTSLPLPGAGTDLCWSALRIAPTSEALKRAAG